MGFLTRLRFPKRRAAVAAQPAPAAPQTTQPPTQGALAKPPIKSLTELEQELEAAMLTAHPVARTRSSVRQVGKTALFLSVALGIPAAVLGVANLPYAPIRYPMARHAPILLLPSYMSADQHYRQAITHLEQAKQLINGATTAADIDLGAESLMQAQKSLDALPIWLWDGLPNYRYRWYDWRFSPSSLNAARIEAGRLQSKVFQERNAQTGLVAAEQALATAKQNYQQSFQQPNRQIQQQSAIQSWQAALDQLAQLPPQTLAGKVATQKLAAYQRDFQEVVGLASGGQQTASLIDAARQFGARAAQASQNPPHSVAEWRRVESLWQDAIARLQQVRSTDVNYGAAQALLAEYTDNLEQIRVRTSTESQSAQALASAEAKINRLIATLPDQAGAADRNRVIAQLQAIITELEQVQPGTTAYLDAQSLLLSAQNRLTQMQGRQP